MLNADAYRRDLTAQIADWPAAIRHYHDPNDPMAYHEVAAGLNTTDDISRLMEGGLLDDFSMEIIVVAETLTPLPVNRDRVDLQQADGSWKRLEVKRVPDIYDPLGSDFRFTAGTPNA